NRPKVMLSSALNDSAHFSNSSTPPSSNHQRFKDLLIFEERLKQNLHQLQRRSYKYEGDNELLLK
ncbi:10222_t:CDS:1, partial [Funneliformis geosporum]